MKRRPSTWWLVFAALWTASVFALDGVLHDHRVLPILVVVPVIALATQFEPRVVVAVSAFDLALTTALGLLDPDVTASRLIATLLVIIMIGGLSAWVSTLRTRLEVALLLARHDASHDPLTGLHNRRAIDSAASALVRDHRSAVTVAMADVDHFKWVNDAHGHAIGDEVLVEVGQRLRASLRVDDLVGRYGGEEFLLILRGDVEHTRDVVKRVVETVRASPVTTSVGAIDVRISLGVSGVNGDGLEEAIHHADEAMYRSKAEGRDRVTVWG